MGQFRRLGCSLDYSRERFTMDDDYVRAVMTFFVRLWDRGWIYRANRIVNWCPFHQTAISDLEVVHEEMDDTLLTIRYAFADGDGREGVSIATVRPATILGDVAVAVHPDDERYASAVGRDVVVPYTERRVPVIADARIDPRSGRVRSRSRPGTIRWTSRSVATPGCPTPIVIGLDGRMNEAAGDLDGLTQEEAGARVVAWAEERWSRGASRIATRSEPASVAIRGSSLSSRSSGGAPWRSRQSPRSQRSASVACATTRSRNIVSRSHRSRTPDWCISRQLWWGHQLPIWYCPDGHATVRVDPPTACAEWLDRARTRVRRPRHVVLVSVVAVRDVGWPDETPELARYYPGNVNSTARARSSVSGRTG